MREERHPLSVRKLFPLLFSGMITVCIAVLIVLFSRYVSGQIQNNVQTDTARQMDALSAGLEQEIQSMSDVINQVYYQILKTSDGTQTQFTAGNPPSCIGPSSMNDFFLSNGTIQIISSKAQSQLGNRHGQHYPKGLDMIHIIQNQSGQSHHLHILPGTNPLQIIQPCIGRVEREGDKGLKTTGFILNIP